MTAQSKIGSAPQQRFAKAGIETPPQRGAALDRNGLSVSAETACRFEPKSPVGNSEICRIGEQPADPPQLKALLAPYPAEGMIAWPVSPRVGNVRNNDAGLIEPPAAME